VNEVLFLYFANNHICC